MDYGQPVNSNDRTDFFTSGAGSNQENVNNFEAENNVDLNNEQADWGASPARSNRNIGNIAINAPVVPKSIEEQVMPAGEILPAVGEIVNTGTPAELVDNGDVEAVEVSEKFNRKKIKTGELLDDEGVGEVRAVIQKLNQDGNVADFYDTAREMMETNLVNSYGEKAAWKGGKKNDKYF